MKPLPTLRRSAPLQRGALRHEVVVRLLEAIFLGELPAGTRLIAQRLAEQFGISPTPVREALVELEAVSMIEFVHNRGAVVKPFGRQQLRETYHLRAILETEATRCACGRIDRAALSTIGQQMQQLLQAGDGPEWSRRMMEVDQQLHQLIAASCGNSRLNDEIRRYATLMQTTRELVGNRRNVQEQALLEHMAIIEALLAGDASRAAEEMTRHIDSTARSVEAIMFANR